MAKIRKILRNITIRDIAAEAMLSTATVSKALSGEQKGMSQKTREKILEIASRLNYFPNLHAQTLAGQIPKTLGIVIPQTSEFAFSNPYYAEIIRGISKKAHESGYHLIFAFPKEEESYLQIYRQRLVPGIIIVASRLDDPRIAASWEMGLPMVLIPGCNSDEIPSVDIDNVGAAFTAVEHLIKIGHRQIGFLNGLSNSKYSLKRLEGFRKAFKTNHILINKIFVFFSGFTQEAGYVGMKKLLSFNPPPTAALIITDYSSIGAIRAAKEMGVRIPEDISIVSFGDVPFACMLNPPLTTIRQPFQQIGYEAVEMLLKKIHGERLARRHRILPTELIIRESTAPLKRDR